MQHRTRSESFVRNFVDAATVRPLWTALLEMKQSRARLLRPAAPTPVSVSVSDALAPVAQKAA